MAERQLVKKFEEEKEIFNNSFDDTKTILQLENKNFKENNLFVLQKKFNLVDNM